MPARRRRSSPPPPSDNSYDYLLKIILLGPSGSGKTSLLHYFLHNAPLRLSSQTIGVEFATKILTIGTPGGRSSRRVKLQIWDTAGTERFRSVSRSYYRGAAGAVLVYDISREGSFRACETFLRDARALGSRGLGMIMVGNKTDCDHSGSGSVASSWSRTDEEGDNEEDEDDRKDPGWRPARIREVSADAARSWAGKNGVSVCLETSARTGDGVDDVFHRLARMILTKIELGEVDPDDPNSGIQYGDLGGWGGTDVGDGRSVRSGMTVDDGGSLVGYSGQNRRGKGLTLDGMTGGSKKGGRCC